MAPSLLPPEPPLPAPLQIAALVARPLELFSACRRRYGDAFRLALPPLAEVVFVSHPEDVRAVFTADPEAARAGEANAVLRPIVGRRSLLTLDGEPHLRHRRMLMPPFHGERMQVYGEVMRTATERAIARMPVGQAFSLRPYLQDVTIEVILRAVFGMGDDARTREIGRVFAEMADTGNSVALMLPFLQRDVGPWRQVRRALERGDEALRAQIARRRREGADGDDVLSLLLAVRDERGEALDEAELRDELVTLLLAGHETTATGLAWAIELLVRSPDAYERARAEARAGGLDGLPFLDAVVREALRIRPVIANVGRRLSRALPLRRWSVPAGAYVAPCIHLVHRREDLYPEPEAFRPERFLGRRPDPYGWLPFGGGVRRCIGMQFALTEMRIVLATLLRSAELRAAEARPAPVVRRGITLVPAGGTRVVRAR